LHTPAKGDVRSVVGARWGWFTISLTLKNKKISLTLLISKALFGRERKNEVRNE